MKTTRFIPLAMSMLFMMIAFDGCSPSHETMRGSVMTKFEEGAHICIGTGDGIQVGDVMVVYRIKVDNTWWLPDYQRRVPAVRTVPQRYQKIQVGEVRVTEIFDEHFAAVTLINGELQSNDIVEKRRHR